MIFLHITSKLQVTKEKIDKFGFIKIKNFYAWNTIKRVTGQSIKWEKYLQITHTHTHDKDLVLIIYKELLYSTTKDKNLI